MKTIEEGLFQFSEKTKQLEEEFYLLKTTLAESHLTLENILSHISAGLIFITQEGKITAFNKEAEKITEYSASEVLEKSFWEFFSDHLFGFSMKKALLEKEKKKTIFLNLHNGTREHHLEVSFSQVPEKGIILLMHDATEVRKLKQTVNRNERLKEIGEMAARLAHEIRNPLGGIEGFAHLLLRDLKDLPKQAQMASAILEGTRLLNRLVTSVLHYARPLEVHFARWDLVALTKEVLSLVLAEEKEGKSTELLCEKECCFAIVDKELFEMALLNLIKNAFEASLEKGKIKILVSQQKKEISIAIQDEGEGIAREHLEKIFTPFFTTKAKGTGLGLSEAHKVIEAHGGKIEIVTQEGFGSTFTIKIPGDDED